MRKHLRRLERVWLDRQVYIVTVNTRQRRRVLTGEDLAEALTAAFRDASEKTGWRVGHYVIMPDHVHFFCSPTPEADKLSDFVGRWKSQTTRAAGSHSGGRYAKLERHARSIAALLYQIRHVA